MSLTGAGSPGWEDLAKGCAPAEPGPWGRSRREGGQGQDGAHEPGLEPLTPFLTQPAPPPRPAKGQGRWEEVNNPRKCSLKDMKMKSIKEIKMEISRQQLLF